MSPRRGCRPQSTRSPKATTPYVAPAIAWEPGNSARSLCRACGCFQAATRGGDRRTARSAPSVLGFARHRRVGDCPIGGHLAMLDQPTIPVGHESVAVAADMVEPD